jgi:hypothetical protein
VLIGIALGIAIGFGLFIASLAFPLLLDRLAGRTPDVFVSPDGAHRVVITARTGLGGIDPPVQLWINLEEVTTGAVVDQLILGIDEASDVGRPSAEWSAGEVVVSDLEGEHNVKATLRRGGRR